MMIGLCSPRLPQHSPAGSARAGSSPPVFIRVETRRVFFVGVRRTLPAPGRPKPPETCSSNTPTSSTVLVPWFVTAAASSSTRSTRSSEPTDPSTNNRPRPERSHQRHRRRPSPHSDRPDATHQRIPERSLTRNDSVFEPHRVHSMDSVAGPMLSSVGPRGRRPTSRRLCPCTARKVGRRWSSCVSVLVDEAVASMGK